MEAACSTFMNSMAEFIVATHFFAFDRVAPNQIVNKYFLNLMGEIID